jgi:hypothetical protein
MPDLNINSFLSCQTLGIGQQPFVVPMGRVDSSDAQLQSYNISTREILPENVLLSSGHGMTECTYSIHNNGGGGGYRVWNFSSPLQKSFQHRVEHLNPYMLDNHQTIQNLTSSVDTTPSFCTRNIHEAHQKMCSLLVQSSEERILILVSRLSESTVYCTVSGFTTLSQICK